MDNDQRATGFDGGEAAQPEAAQPPGDHTTPSQDGGEGVDRILFWDAILVDEDMPAVDKYHWMGQSLIHLNELVNAAHLPARQWDALTLLLSAVKPVFGNRVVLADPLAGEQIIRWLHSTCNLIWDQLPATIKEGDPLDITAYTDGGYPPLTRSIGEAMAGRIQQIVAVASPEQIEGMRNRQLPLGVGAAIDEAALAGLGHTSPAGAETLVGGEDVTLCTDANCPVCLAAVRRILFDGPAQSERRTRRPIAPTDKPTRKEAPPFA